jgi:hypothetical protein
MSKSRVVRQKPDAPTRTASADEDRHMRASATTQAEGAEMEEVARWHRRITSCVCDPHIGRDPVFT